ncbi:4'-phosphopantetheinyl transferase family protein [Feifania hominis]|uniref:4'-phosphopantetheinyl transferase superfamily protein n=1 Tax=Feifania hominis TaxID=2763660 RepID=A0A926HU93_9FIRM|nr:4'-phosphopantetheinyl transferase superfamily protein [Feifania hominis]MBC8536674.1 4'-phosphopantetheinyl transferase superfamily protein [Feifania hominis]
MTQYYFYQTPGRASYAAVERQVKRDAAAFLRACCRRPPLAVRLVKNALGAPGVEGAPEICVSYSHSGPYFAMALSTAPVGIDIEQRRPVNLAVARRFAPAEQDYVTCEGERGFFALWTLKEAYLKLLGRGIAGGLASFSVVDAGRIKKCCRDHYLGSMWISPSLCLGIASDEGPVRPVQSQFVLL